MAQDQQDSKTKQNTQPPSGGFLFEVNMYPLMTNVTAQFVDDNGRPLAGGKVWTYESGTTTPKATYADPDGLAVNTNPVILDEAGRANIYLEDGAYRIRVLSGCGVLVADTNKLSRYVTSTELDEFIQQVQDGLDELNQVKESLNTYVEQGIEAQKGVAGGLAPLDENDKIDPIYFPALPNSSIPQATEEKIGVAEIATQTEVNAATDNTKIITPSKLLAGVKNHLNASSEAPMFACRAWVNFNGTTGEIRGSGNIASVVVESNGTYAITFTTPMSDANYAISGVGSARGDATALAPVDGTFTVNGFKVRANFGGDNTAGSYSPLICCVAVFR